MPISPLFAREDVCTSGLTRFPGSATASRRDAELVAFLVDSFGFILALGWKAVYHNARRDGLDIALFALGIRYVVLLIKFSLFSRHTNTLLL